MFVTIIIVVQTIVFLITQQSWQISAQSLNTFSLIPTQFLQYPSLYSVFTAMWIHENVYHLLGNIFLLWIFGKDLEKKLHAIPFLIY